MGRSFHECQEIPNCNSAYNFAPTSLSFLSLSLGKQLGQWEQGRKLCPCIGLVWGLRPSPTEHSDKRYNSGSLRKTEKLRVSDWVLSKWTLRRQFVWRKFMGSALRIGISEEVSVGQREELNYHQQRHPWTACWVLGLDWISSTVQSWGKDVGLSTPAWTGHWPQATRRKRIMTVIGYPWLRVDLESSSVRAVSHQLSASGPWCLHPAREAGPAPQHPPQAHPKSSFYKRHAITSVPLVKGGGREA